MGHQLLTIRLILNSSDNADAALLVLSYVHVHNLTGYKLCVTKWLENQK